MPKNTLYLKVKFTQIGAKVKYTLPVRMVCEHNNQEIANSMTLNKDDMLITYWLGENVNINEAYDHCDKPKSK